MKQCYALTILLMVLLGSQAYAQDDSIVYVNGLPITGEDSIPDQETSRALPLPEDRIRMEPGKIPAQLKKVLMSEAVYRGWDKLPVYHDKKTGLYIVQIKEKQDLKTFGFDEEGHVVKLKEITVNPDQQD